MSLTRDDVAKVAQLARIGLDEDELAELAPQIAGILEHVGHIAELDLAGVPPTSHPLDIENRFGEDVPRPSLPRASLLALAPDPAPDGFRVPPIGA